VCLGPKAERLYYSGMIQESGLRLHSSPDAGELMRSWQIENAHRMLLLRGES
jgi:hypothetical protein